jgi:hypothetical protein
MAAMQQGGVYKEVRITVSSSPTAVGRKTIARTSVEEECSASNWSGQSERCWVACCIIEKYISSCCTIILQSVCSQVSPHLSHMKQAVCFCHSIHVYVNTRALSLLPCERTWLPRRRWILISRVLRFRLFTHNTQPPILGLPAIATI